MIEFLKKLIAYFDKYEIPYMLSGSMAMSTYTGPRYTRDFDFIVHLRPSDVEKLTAFFKDGFYFDEDSIKEAIATEGMFNIIDHKSNYKADFVMLKNHPYRKVEFERKHQVRFLEIKIWIVAPEDLLISKLIWIQELRSSQQESDIKTLSQLQGMDWSHINGWIKELKLNTFDLLLNE